MGKQVDKGKACAVLAYILVGIIWFFADEKMRKNNYAKFHVKQGIVLLIASIVINVVGVIIPFIGWFIILPLGGLFILVLWIIGLINAGSGKENALPLIGQFADKFDF